MNKRDGLVFGILIGAAAMFLLDPARGRRRRALVRDRLVHQAHEIGELGTAIGSRARHFRNRARGTIIEVKARLPHEVIDDEVLERRVRAHLARLVRQPETIHVTAEHGRVTLRGIEPEEGAGELVAHVEEIDGVHDVVNRLKGRQAAP
jgi:gas vesicle protein